MPVLWSLNSEKRLQNRKYLSLDKKRFSSELTGKDLPAHQMADSLSSKRDRAEELIQSVKIFSSLPNKFLDQLFQIQQSKHPIVFPTMKHDKSHTVGSCIRASMYPALLDISKWRELGWGSQKEYQAWLSTSMLFAFSGTAHYCSAPRVFDYKYPDARDESVFERLAPNEIKTTNILSVAGFEYRGYSGDVAGSYEDVAYYSTHIMSMILRAAEETKTTHIVLIPFGMGVFLPQDESYKSKIKENILEGWIDGLSNYKGPKITIHCCLFPGHFATIQDRVSQNKQIELVNTQGQDAYVLTNRLQDSGHNTFMVNAGDHDWIALLDKEGTPGQCGRNHTLFHSTADEYLSLMTLFSFFSIQNMYKFLTRDQINKSIITANISPLNQAQDDYLTQRDLLKNTLTEIESQINHNPNQTLRTAYFEARKILTELDKQYALDLDGQSLQNVPKTELLYKLTTVCSRVVVGLKFVQHNGATMHCTPFYRHSQVDIHYDSAEHTLNMAALHAVAGELKGHGLQKLGHFLIGFALLLLIITGILACISSGGSSLLAVVGSFSGIHTLGVTTLTNMIPTLSAGSAATLSTALGAVSIAGVIGGLGLFVKQDQGLAQAVHHVKMSYV